MENLAEKREIIERIIKEHAAIPFTYIDLKQTPIFDRQNDNYLLVVHGRENRKRIHSTVIHVEIIDGKFWIHEDGTEDGIATDLLENGISKQEIVLAFHAPEKRRYTEFAVA